MIKYLPDKNQKNIIGFMIGREALSNPDCFIESSNVLNKKSFVPRTKEQIKQEFLDNCSLHPPRDIYMKKISDFCWMK